MTDSDQSGQQAQTRKQTSANAAEPSVRDRIKARLVEIDEGIDAIEAKARELRDDAKETAHEKIAALRKGREAVASRLAELGEAGGEAMDDLKKGAASAWDELRQSARDLSAGVSKAADRLRGGDRRP